MLNPLNFTVISLFLCSIIPNNGAFLELKTVAARRKVLQKLDNSNLNIMSLCQISSTNNKDLVNCYVHW